MLSNPQKNCHHPPHHHHLLLHQRNRHLNPSCPWQKLDVLAPWNYVQLSPSRPVSSPFLFVPCTPWYFFDNSKTVQEFKYTEIIRQNSKSSKHSGTHCCSSDSISSRTSAASICRIMFCNVKTIHQGELQITMHDYEWRHEVYNHCYLFLFKTIIHFLQIVLDFLLKFFVGVTGCKKGEYK